MEMLMHGALRRALKESLTGVGRLQESLEQQQDGIERCINLLVEAHDQDRKVFIFAPGRSGLVAQAFCSRLVQMGLCAQIVGTMTTTCLQPGDPLILVSSSGTTRVTRFVADIGRQYGAQLIVITGNPQSPLAQMAEVVLIVPAPFPDGELPLSSLSEQMGWVLLDGLVVELLQRLALPREHIARAHPNLE